MEPSKDTKTRYRQLNEQEQWIHLNLNECKHLFLYYFLSLLVSFVIFIASIIFHYTISSFNQIIGLILFSILGGLMGSNIYYIRKLYKSCIQFLISPSEENFEHEIRKIGAKAYFYTRPIISAILSLLISLGIYAGFYLFQNSPSISNEKYFIFCTLISFYIGFCNGKIIVDLDQQGESIINLLFGANKNENK
jgi:hypothetical protein